jgi:uncharacterized phiE125 gp8 family phage protein
MKLDARRIKITTQPTIEPVSRADAKLHCRIDGATEDVLIDGWIEAARQQCEDIAGRAFVKRTYTAYLDYWPVAMCLELPYPPLIAVASIKYYDIDGNAAVTYDAANYLVDTYSEPGRIAFKSNASWPSVILREINGVEIIYSAGFGTADTDVPARYKAAMYLMIAHFYEHRESVLTEAGTFPAILQQGVYDLLQTDKVQ